jgi:hypothetical protein
MNCLVPGYDACAPMFNSAKVFTQDIRPEDLGRFVTSASPAPG